MRFSATAATVGVTREPDWQQVQVAEDTLVDLENLEFRGTAGQDVRSALIKARKDGIESRLVRLVDQPPAIREQVRVLSQEWIGDKGLPEMGFTLGGVAEAMDPATRWGSRSTRRERSRASRRGCRCTRARAPSAGGRST